MNLQIDRLQHQIRAAERRYHAREEIREERLALARGRQRKGDWRKVESQERVFRYLKARGLDAASRRLLDEDTVAITAPVRPDGPDRMNFLERILGENDLLGASFLPLGAAVRRSVGRVIDRQSGFGFGTGFLVSERLLMTNNHVLATPQEAAASAAQFDFLVEPEGTMATPTVFALEPMTFFLTDGNLDYTLVAVAATNADGASLAGRGWSPLIEESGKALLTTRVNLIQHPGGRVQQVALRENEIIDVDFNDHFTHYQADTEPGSSGSPVFNDLWELAALHHAGVPDRDPQGRILLTDGSRWDGSQATIHLIRWIANEGVRISSIVADVKAHRSSLTTTQRQLFDAAFDARPVVGLEGRREESNWQRDATRSGLADGSASWTIPLHVRVNLGDLATATGGDQVPRPAQVRVPPEPTEDPAELQQAFRRLEDFSAQPYYDVAADEQAAADYYANTPNEAQPTEWFQVFSELIRTTHTTELSYRRARLDFLYPWVDLHETAPGQRELRSVYSGLNFDPREILTMELRMEARRAARLREILATEGALSEEALEAQLDLLEAQFPFNCEHVVPQSWFSKAQPMKADMHHLFTCESGCNSFRSNIPYFNFDPEEEVVRSECGRREGDRFEPEASHGAVARATLYFLLRYPGLVGNVNSELQPERLEVLLTWNEDDPPTEYEFHRNAEIARVQGNRNPVIDFSPMARDIDFSGGFGG